MEEKLFENIEKKAFKTSSWKTLRKACNVLLPYISLMLLFHSLFCLKRES